MARRGGRKKNQLPHCYYEDYLEKRSFKDKKSQKLWTSLCGNTIFFFNEMRDSDYVEKLELSDFVSVADDSSPDRNLDAARFTLQMKDENIKFTASNPESRELWKGYIQSVAELLVPTSLNLLPGQIHMLREVVQKEKDRTSQSAVSSPYISIVADMPACYYKVSRVEAELLLEKEAKTGNLLLRPGSDNISFAISTRQDLNGAVFRHYRVSQKHEGHFIIDVENPVPCATLHDVITYLVDKTDGYLIPLNIEGPYEKTISFISADNENGEVTQQPLPNLDPPSLPPKPVSSKLMIPTPKDVPDAEENNPNPYINEIPQQKTAKVALKPPTSTVRRIFPVMPRPSSPLDPGLTANKENTNQIPQAAITELKLRFQAKAKCED